MGLPKMLDYTNIEFQERLERVTDLLKNADGWGDAYDSSTGQTLIQLLVHTTDELAYMLQRRTTESYLETAQLRSSIIARACELGYRFKRATANSGYLLLTLQFPASYQITIPAFSVVKYEELEFITMYDTIIPAGDVTASIAVKQSTVVTQDFDLDGDNKLTIPDYEYIDNDFMLVYSNGEIYYDVRSISDVNKRAISFLDSDDAYYDIKYTNQGMCIIFGDGVIGKKPESSVTITHLFVDTEVEGLSVLNRDFEFENPVVDAMGTEIPYSCINTTRISNLTLPEGDMSIKKNATDYHKTNNRATTNSDYSYWAKNIPNVKIVDARAVGEVELNSILYNTNNVYLTYLKNDGTKLTSDERIAVLRFFDSIKTSQAHIVLKDADILKIQAILDIKRNPKLPISDSELYDLLRKYLVNYFTLGEGSIGRELQRSDFIRDLYKESVTRNGIDYALIDYCNFDMNGVYEFSVPVKTTTTTVNLAIDYPITIGHTFVLVIANIVCSITVDDGDDRKTILEKMIDKIKSVTPFDAKMILGSVVLDAFGNPITVEIDNNVGEVLLIGVDTPYFSNDSMISDLTVGSAIVKVVNNSSAIDVSHYYYSSPAGRRPMIPLRVGTRVMFTSPSDTAVNVYTRLNKDLESTEVLLTTLSANQTFDETFYLDHVLIFEYVSDSLDDRVAVINYPQFDGSATGIRIESYGVSGEFEVITTSGDLGSYITMVYDIQLPVTSVDPINQTYTRSIEIGSVRFFDESNNPVYEVSEDGTILFVSGGDAGGKIDYTTGIMSLPPTISDGNYKIIYDQDDFENFKLSDFSVPLLIEPKLSFTDSAETLSTINIRK